MLCPLGQGIQIKDVVRKHGAVFALILLLICVPTAVGKAKKSPLSPDSMSASQARAALLAAADSLFVPLPGNVFQAIDAKSMRISPSSVVFDGAADSINGGRHRYRILFTSFESVSAKCNSMSCIVTSKPPGTLARNESGEALGDVLFTNAHKESSTLPPTCPVECRKIALDFVAALNGLRVMALTRQISSSDFPSKAAAWRAMDPKPPIPEEVRVNRRLAEDAVKNNKPEEALRYYEAGLELYPTWPQGSFNAALIAAELKFYADAVEHMQAYLELVPAALDAQSARDQIVIWQHKAGEPK